MCGALAVGGALTLALPPGAGPIPTTPTALDTSGTAVRPELRVGADRSVTLLSMGGQATDPVLNRVAGMLTGATDRVEAFWGTDWPREIVIVATDTPDQFATAAPGAAPQMAAVAVADSVDISRRTAEGQRIVLAPKASEMSDAALELVLTHELFHYAARAQTHPQAPRWITEAVADYLARPEQPRPPAATLPAALPDDTDFDTTGAALSQAYDRAWWFARFIADRYGEDALHALYVESAGANPVPLPEALADATGSTPELLLAEWRRWLAG